MAVVCAGSDVAGCDGAACDGAGCDGAAAGGLAGACAATGLVGKESDLFRFTVRHSLLFALVVGLITVAQAYVLTGMLVP